MRRQNRECWHSIDRQWLRDGGRKRLRKERNPPFGLASGGEELAGVALVALRDEERGSAQAPTAVGGVDLVVQQLLDVLDREQVLAVHRDDDRVPDLGDKDLQHDRQRHAVNM